MNPIARARSLVLLLALSAPACKAGGSFLLFGGSDVPQQGLVNRVHAADDEAKRAQHDFSSSFNLYQRLTTPQAVELESLADEFQDAIDACKDRSKAVTDRTESVRKESDALFKGWTDELTHFSGDTLRKKSESQMQEMQGRAQKVIAALEHVQDRMQPVMLKLQDYALFFHHNLNARAIATLQDTYKDFDAESTALNTELDKARTEIASFLAYCATDPVAKPDKK